MRQTYFQDVSVSCVIKFAKRTWGLNIYINCVTALLILIRWKVVGMQGQHNFPIFIPDDSFPSPPGLAICSGSVLRFIFKPSRWFFKGDFFNFSWLFVSFALFHLLTSPSVAPQTTMQTDPRLNWIFHAWLCLAVYSFWLAGAFSLWDDDFSSYQRSRPKRRNAAASPCDLS